MLTSSFFGFKINTLLLSNDCLMLTLINLNLFKPVLNFLKNNFVCIVCKCSTHG